MKLTKTRLIAGVWEGVLSGAPSGVAPPALMALHNGRRVEGLSLTPGDGGWIVRLPLPADVVSDGIQTIVIAEEGGTEPLESVPVIAGEALADDIRAEMDLLRAELDMLKRAFRRHCVETA